MTTRAKGDRRAAIVLGAPKRMVSRNLANMAVANGEACPFCGAVAIDRWTGEPIDPTAIHPGDIIEAVMEHEDHCPAVDS